LNILSLFDGISCGRIALENAGLKVDTYFASEIEKYSIKVALENYPDTIELGDINLINASDLPQIDLLIGGSPCQDLSLAKTNGKGLEGAKSGLFWQYIRLLKETNPKWFLLENVAMKKEWEIIITDAMGVEPIIINSRLLSGQNRVRYYWTNIPNVTQPIDKNISVNDILETDDINAKCGARRGRKNAEGKYIQLLELRKDNKTSALTTVDKDNLVLDHGVERFLTQTELEKLQTLPIGYTSVLSRNQAGKAIGNAWTVDIITHIFGGLK